MTLVAGVDSSTQSCKVVVRDLESGEVVRQGRASHPDGTSVDPAFWWDALQAALAEAGGLDDVAAISVGGQQHGMVALDADGEVVRDALLWNDTRSAGAAADLIAEFGAEALAERTGLVPVASFTSTKLRWLRDAEPENASRVAAVALPHDWLTWRLRGYGPVASSPLGPVLTELTTDRSDVSGTGYWNPATGEYDRDLLVAALGHDAVVPRVLGPGERAGTVDGSACVVGPGAGDNAAAGLGLGATVGDVVVSLGTSGTVFAVTEQGFRDATGIVAGFASASGEHLPLVCTLNASRVLDAFARVLGVGYDELGELAMEAEPGAGGLTLVPYFEGERTPNLPDATATLSGMTLANTTRANMARAAIEGMLAAQAVGMEAILSAGVVAKRALLVGGSAQNPAVQAIAAQVFDVPVEVPEPGEYVAAGAAAQAAWALTGSRPAWPLAVVAAPAQDTRPEIMEAYAAAAGAYLP
ncbi:FGGY family carbohydrate kinase [Demequina sp. SYSU T00192]|uniref:Xylulose kinase n=1 Tax=Demequina litoralis TaxID=3051660 RepID=A0ABT8GE03_9MICO|nr:FGGY family carbohydrate kinase [Demequina sp. SYSU T00192]MDN4476899.1 FGGY family carbohydrate kinase [Demequina sp. SYSU T00192]